MGCLGTGELVMLVCILLIVFSASRMGRLGNALGRFVYQFRRAARGGDLVDVERLPRPPSPPTIEARRPGE